MKGLRAVRFPIALAFGGAARGRGLQQADFEPGGAERYGVERFRAAGGAAAAHRRRRAGLGLGVRPGGMFLLGYPALAWACRLWLQHRSSQQQLSDSL